MRHSMLWLGTVTVLFALACGGTAPKPEETGLDVPASVGDGPTRVTAPRKVGAAKPVSGAKGATASAPDADGKTRVDLNGGGLSITTKKGTDIEVKPGFFGGISVEGSKTDFHMGNLKKKDKDTDDADKKKGVFPGMSDPEDDL
jgi:hypothetical protein